MAWANCGNSNGATRAKAILEKVQQLYQARSEGLQPDKYAFCAVINAWAKWCSPATAEQAEAILNQMQELYEAGNFDAKPNTVIYTCIITAFACLEWDLLWRVPREQNLMIKKMIKMTLPSLKILMAFSEYLTHCCPSCCLWSVRAAVRERRILLDQSDPWQQAVLYVPLGLPGPPLWCWDWHSCSICLVDNHSFNANKHIPYLDMMYLEFVLFAVMKDNPGLCCSLTCKMASWCSLFVQMAQNPWTLIWWYQPPVGWVAVRLHLRCCHCL